ncbi:MAG: KH domain-containing protein [Bacilli bacterium]|nr:KH domain-containing protein [Bacilli bacterium]
MNITDFATLLISGIVKNPDMVKVSSFEGDEDTTILEILVSNEDMGAVIGKQGRNAKALRTIINAHAYLNNIKKIKINIDSF